ncbi:hypothetical protein AG1IA_02285 [Rhizoctonia solani AG-1 IA]|uniref:Uncharacterized protein n=1 Tax=Thanatephorus cucumeris (strain AG1-IA) TaxID=983506 RepID=L8X4Y3_THACA|nr:hypothetical protein AG1IA_02285 [Rhizoctonia solani AG-1 IA]
MEGVVKTNAMASTEKLRRTWRFALIKLIE